MKKMLPIFLILFIVSCEDEKDGSNVGELNGTYKLSKESMECDGDEDEWYMTLESQGADKLKLTNWDYMGDACDNQSDCYETDDMIFNKDGEKYSATEENPEGSSTLTIEKDGDDIKMTFSIGSVSEDQIWNKESSDIKTYSPICN